MYNAKSLKAEEFISDEEIRETLAYDLSPFLILPSR